MTAESTSTAPRLCQDDNWNLGYRTEEDDGPRAVSWATETLARQFGDPIWSKWHYTEGNGAFTACGRAVVLFMVDGSPKERDVARVTCKTCRQKMIVAGLIQAPAATEKGAQ